MEKPRIDLPVDERRAWLCAQVRKGLDSGDSQHTVDQIWKRAVERAQSDAANPT